MGVLCLVLISVSSAQGFSQNESKPFSDQPINVETRTLNINQSNQTVYNDLSAQVCTRIAEASKYESPKSKDILAVAENELTHAIMMANAAMGIEDEEGRPVPGSWDDAVFYLRLTSDLLDQAEKEEQAYQQANQQQKGLRQARPSVAGIGDPGG